MFAGLCAPAIREVDEVNAVDVKDGEGLGAGLGARALISRMMTDLEDMTGVPQRGFLEKRAIPFLWINTSEPRIETQHQKTRLNHVVRMEAVDSAHAGCAEEIDPSTIEATVLGFLATEFATIVGTRSPTFKPYDLRKDNLAVSLHQ